MSTREEERALVRAVVMGMGRGPSAKPMSLRLWLLLILLGLVGGLGIMVSAGAGSAWGDVGLAGTGEKVGPGRAGSEVTPKEKFSGNSPASPEPASVEALGNNAAANRATLYNFLQNFSDRRAGPEEPQANQPLQLFPATDRREEDLGLKAPVGPVPAGLLIALALCLWAVLAISVRSRRPL